MPTYTVKSGDTKGKLAKELGISIDDKQFRSSDPNKLFAGEVINYGAPVQGPVQAPVQGPIQNGAVDLSKVKEDVKPFAERVDKLRDVSIAFSGKADDAAMQDIADRNPELADNAMDFQGFSTEFVPTTYEELTPEEKLSRTATTIENEIAAIEEKMANSAETRTGALDEAGVFDDMRLLNDLKAELREAQDEEIEIGIKGRQNLRGKQATKTEFDQATRPALEKNLLRTLAASRNTSRLTDTINTNIQIIDSKLAAETARDEFVLSQKVKRLDKVQSIYGDIMTEKQKQAAALQKFQYDVALEDIKSNNTLRSDLLKDLAGKGVVGENYMDMSINELLSVRGDLTSPKSWSEMSYEEAAMVLDKDSFDKFEAYKEFEKTASEEEKAAVSEALTITDTAKSTVDLIEDMLNDKQGLATSVGHGLGNMDFSFLGAGVESSKFRANAKQLLSQKTLDKLLELKAAGGTLGAISEKELEMLGRAATALGSIDDQGKATGRFKFKESDFIEGLETMRIASMKTYIATSIGKEAYANAGYQNADFETIQKRYTALIEAKPEDKASEELVDNKSFTETAFPFKASQMEAALEVIRQEEGLRTEAYQDSTGTWTIGFGNTQINGRPVQPGDKLTVAQSENLMQQSVVNNYTTFADSVKDNITPNQFAALTSFEYNLGPGVWNSTTGRQILSLVNAGRYTEAGNLMQAYNKSRNPATGQLELNPVLAQRRVREANLLLT